jgi:ATP-binding cassette, subfamily C, bacterial CydC
MSMNSAGTISRWLLGLTKPFWRNILLSIILQVVTILAGIGLLATSAWLISKAALQPSIADLGLAPVAVRFFGISRAVFRYMERLVTHNVTFRLLANLRVWFYTAIEPLAPARLMHYRSGDLLERVVSDINTLENVYARVIAPPVVALIVAGAITPFFYAADPMIALILLAFMVFTGTAVPLWTWWSGKTTGQQIVQSRAEINALLVDMIQGIADSIAYGYTQSQLTALDGLTQNIATHENKAATQAGLEAVVSTLLVNVAALVILVMAIPRVDGLLLATLTLGTIAAFEAVTPISIAMQHLGANLSAADRLLEIASESPQVSDSATSSPHPQDYGLNIRNLSFRYNADDALVFDQLSLTMNMGQKVAIVGASGAGKSTLTNILLRFWDYEGGEITLGGHDLRAYQSSDLYDIFGVMSQRTHLFNTTIRENIHIARKEAAEDAIIAAAKQAQIHDFIQSLPNGYNTMVGENGVNISGGERQRIALARVLLKKAQCFILDEATANLDSVTEQKLMESILTVTQNRSMILMTHRLALLEHIDHIFVLQNGRIAEQGTHNKLLATRGLYHRLWLAQKQAAVFNEAGI